MPPSMGIFSRRKTSEDKSLRNMVEASPIYNGANNSVVSASSADSTISASPYPGAAAVGGEGSVIPRRMTPNPQEKKIEKKLEKKKSKQEKKDKKQKDNTFVLKPGSVATSVYAGGVSALAFAPPSSSKRTAESATPTFPRRDSGTFSPGLTRPTTSASESSKRRVNRSKSEVTPSAAAFALDRERDLGSRASSREHIVPFTSSSNTSSRVNIASPSLHHHHSQSSPAPPLPYPIVVTSPVPRHTPTPPRPSPTPPNPAQEIPLSLSQGVGILPNELPNPIPSFNSSPSDSPKTPKSPLSLSPFPPNQALLAQRSAYLNGNGPNPGPNPISTSSPNTSTTNLDSIPRTGSPITPPVSPEGVGMSGSSQMTVTALGLVGPVESGINGPINPPVVHRKKKAESDLIMEIAALKKALSQKDDLISRLDPTGAATRQSPNTPNSPKSEAQRVNQILCRRIRDLEKENIDKEEIITRHSSKFQTLRQSHNTLIDTIKLSHDAEIASLRESVRALEKIKGVSVEDMNERRALRKRETELLSLLKEKDEELASYKRDTNELRGRIIYVEKLIAQREGELEVAEKRIHRLSEDPTSLSRIIEEDEEGDGLSEMELRVLEEIRKREATELELDETVLRHKANLEEALSNERARGREELERRLVEERQKRNDFKATTWKEVEAALVEEEQKKAEYTRATKEQLEERMAHEEKLRAKLLAEFEKKLLGTEELRKTDRDYFEDRLEKLMGSEKNLLNQTRELQARIEMMEELLDRDKNTIAALKSGHEDVMQVAKRINERLGEEKAKNRQLEGTISSLSQGASESGTEVVVLKNQIENKETQIHSLEKEVEAWKTEFKSLDDAWKKMEAESKSLRQLLDERDAKIKNFEDESGVLAESIQAFKSEIHDLKKKARRNSTNPTKAQGEYSKFVDNSHLDLDLDGGLSNNASTETIEQQQQELAELKKEIDLYKLDVKGYRRDIKRRDAQINALSQNILELEAMLHKKGQELYNLRDELQMEKRLPNLAGGSTDQNIQIFAGKISSVKDENLQLKARLRMYEDEYKSANDERESLKKRLETFTSQQGMVIADLEGKVVRMRREKEDMERKVKKLSNLVKQQSHLPPLPHQDSGDRISPSGEHQSSQTPMSPNSSSNPRPSGRGSKRSASNPTTPGEVPLSTSSHRPIPPIASTDPSFSLLFTPPPALNLSFPQPTSVSVTPLTASFPSPTLLDRPVSFLDAVGGAQGSSIPLPPQPISLGSNPTNPDQHTPSSHPLQHPPRSNSFSYSTSSRRGTPDAQEAYKSDIDEPQPRSRRGTGGSTVSLTPVGESLKRLSIVRETPPEQPQQQYHSQKIPPQQQQQHQDKTVKVQRVPVGSRPGGTSSGAPTIGTTATTNPIPITAGASQPGSSRSRDRDRKEKESGSGTSTGTGANSNSSRDSMGNEVIFW